MTPPMVLPPAHFSARELQDHRLPRPAPSPPPHLPGRLCCCAFVVLAAFLLRNGAQAGYSLTVQSFCVFLPTQINQPKLPLRTLDPRILARGPDFTPAFADFGRQLSGGRGTSVSVSCSRLAVCSVTPPDTTGGAAGCLVMPVLCQALCLCCCLFSLVGIRPLHLCSSPALLGSPVAFRSSLFPGSGLQRNAPLPILEALLSSGGLRAWISQPGQPPGEGAGQSWFLCPCDLWYLPGNREGL